jgi:hypothetical protein
MLSLPLDIWDQREHFFGPAQDHEGEFVALALEVNVSTLTIKVNVGEPNRMRGF